MSALWFLHSVASHHSVLTEVLTQETKLKIWEKLITAVRTLLDNQSEDGYESKTSLDGCGLNQPATVKTPSRKQKGKRKHEEIDIEDGKEEKKQSQTCAHVEMNTVDEKVKYLERIFSHTGGTSILQNELVSKKLQTVSQTSTQTAEDNSETVPTASGIMFQLKCAVFKGTVEKERCRLLLQQTQTVVAAMLVSFEIDQFRDVIRQLEHDVVGTKLDIGMF